MSTAINAFLQRNQLPSSYIETAKQWFGPLIEQFADSYQADKPAQILGINGCQGSGKSTLADYLCSVIAERLGITTVCLSMDDFYLTKAARTQLATDVHPLLATRGVPGTHDIQLAIDCINSLIAGDNHPITRFDKSLDDRVSADKLETLSGPVGLIVLEGWCLGARPVPASQLREPVNSLEALDDAQGIWRNYVNQALAGDYQQLFAMVDRLVMLKAPSFDAVFQWRLEQETKMIRQLKQRRETLTCEVMNDQQIGRFIQHFQRITENLLRELPERAEHVLQLDCNRQISSDSQPAAQ